MSPDPSDFRVRHEPPIAIVDQFEWLPQRARGRDVLHLGCVDDRITLDKLGAGRLLHARLADTARQLTGFDISAEGLETVASAVPGDYVHGDVERLDSYDLPDVDLVIAAEIIEHLGSPGAFLEALERYLTSTGATALITTPNAFGWRVMSAFVGRQVEATHPDHRLIYTPATLRRTIELAGLELRGLYAHTWREGRAGAKQRTIDVVDRSLLRWNPWLAVGIIAEVTSRSAVDREAR